MVLDLGSQHGPKKPWLPEYPFGQFPEADVKPPANLVSRLPHSHPNQCRLPLPIAQALKESCDIQTTDFAMIYVNERGNVHYKGSPAISLRLAEIFPKEFCQKFLNIIDQAHGSHPRVGTHERGVPKDRYRSSEAKRAEHGSGPRVVGERQKRLASEIEPSVSRTKSYDPSYSFSASAEEDDDPSDPDVFEGAGEMMTTFRIDDEEALVNFYKTRFLQMQQIPCKIVNKAWVKVVQPKKQARHPYNGGRKAVEAGDAGNGELTKPDWWPPEGTRHREPDHIQKPERLTLLLHILRNLYDYHGVDGRQIRVEELQQSTKDCFADEPKYRKANDWLNNIYHVRKQEERYFRGEIDGTAKISISMPDKEPREIVKKSKAKAQARVKRRRQTSSSSLSTAPQQDTLPQNLTLGPPLQSPTELSSPIAHLDVRQFKQELSVNVAKSLALKLEDQQAFQRAALQYQQPTQLADSRAPFSYPTDQYPLRRRSGTQSISHGPLYAPRVCQDDSNLSFIPTPVNTFTIQGGSTAKQGQRQSDMYTQDAGTWHSPPLTQSFGSQQEWSYAPPMITPQQTASPFATSTATENQTVPISTPSLAQISPTSTYVLTGPQYFPQDLGLASFGDISTTHVNPSHSQGPDMRIIGAYSSFTDG